MQRAGSRQPITGVASLARELYPEFNSQAAIGGEGRRIAYALLRRAESAFEEYELAREALAE